MTEPPVVDWQRTPHLGGVWWVAFALTVVGGVGVFAGLFISVIYGTALTIAGAVLVGAAAVCWCLYAVALWWRQESRNQMLTTVAAMTRHDAQV